MLRAVILRRFKYILSYSTWPCLDELLIMHKVKRCKSLQKRRGQEAMAACNKWRGWHVFHSHSVALCGKSHRSSPVVASSAFFLDVSTETSLRKILQWAGGCLQRNPGMHSPWEKGLLWLLGNWLIPTKIKRSTQNKKKGKKKSKTCTSLTYDWSFRPWFFSSVLFFFPFCICQFNSLHRAVCGIWPLYNSCWAFQSLDKWWCSIVGHWNEVRIGSFK